MARFSVDSFGGRRLPYADNLVNLLVVSDDCGIDRDEMLRVLVPKGVAWFVHPPSAIGDSQFVKPRPKDIDDWTHYLHDASGNAVAADLRGRNAAACPVDRRAALVPQPRIQPQPQRGRFGRRPDVLHPRRGPRRHPRLARDSAFPSGGRSSVATPSAAWSFGSVRFRNWGYREWNTIGMWSAPLTLARRLVTDGSRVFFTFGYKAAVTVLDAATGATLGTISDSEGTDEMVLADGVLDPVRSRAALRRSASAGRKGCCGETPCEGQGQRKGPCQAESARMERRPAGTGAESWPSTCNRARNSGGPPPQTVMVLTLAASATRVLFP